MKKIRYLGPLPSIEIDLAGRTGGTGRTVRASRGNTIEVPESIADELLAREEWTQLGTESQAIPFPSVPESGTNEPTTSQPLPDL